MDESRNRDAGILKFLVGIRLCGGLNIRSGFFEQNWWAVVPTSPYVPAPLKKIGQRILLWMTACQKSLRKWPRKSARISKYCHKKLLEDIYTRPNLHQGIPWHCQSNQYWKKIESTCWKLSFRHCPFLATIIGLLGK